MKKAILCFIISAVLLISFCGCGSQTVNGLSEGAYICKQDSESVLSPHIRFDFKDNSFTFYFDSLSSYLAIGNFEIEKGQVIAKTDDGKYTYIFDIIDNNTIRFEENGSSEIKMTDGESVISDGCEFVFTEK